MSAVILEWATTLALAMLALAMGFAAYRLVIGPRAQDRFLAIDTMFNISVLIVLALGIRMGSMMYFPIALILATIGFVSSAALAKFMMRGEVIEKTLEGIGLGLPP